MPIDQDQKDFIKNKVRELGSVHAVKELYFKDCLVDRWAIVYANKLYNKSKKFSTKK